jgi:hypothetical protein
VKRRVARKQQICLCVFQLVVDEVAWEALQGWPLDAHAQRGWQHGAQQPGGVAFVREHVQAA